MATQTLPHVVSFPQSVPAEAIPVREVSQRELIDLIEASNVLSALTQRVDSLESDIKARLEKGASIEPGVHTAELKEGFRRSVAWKEVVIRFAKRLKLDGERYCDKLLARTKPSRSVSLVVD